MGTQDSFELAEAYYEVRGQPTLILVDRAGLPLGTWNFLSDELVQLVEAA